MKPWRRYEQRAEEIVAHLRASGPATLRQIEQSIGLRPGGLQRPIRRLVSEGRVRVAGCLERDDVRGTKPILYGVAE